MTEIDIEDRLMTHSPECTKDAFHNGSFFVLQPKSGGNRSGMDALLLAAALPAGLSGLLADLGGGAGVAGIASINRSSDLNVIVVERNQVMAGLARETKALSENQHLSDRISILEADVNLTGIDRHRAGLFSNSVDHVIMNPPYNTKHLRAPENDMRAEAFMMAEGGLDAWFRTATAIMRPGGIFAMIYRTESLGEVIACAQGRFGNLEIIPIHSKQGEPAKRMIVRGKKASRAPLSILPGFVVHSDVEKFSPSAKLIFDGKAGIE